MKILRIYVDTSVLGGCFDPEFAPWSNGLVEDFRRAQFKPVLSDVTAAEVEQAPEIIRRVHLDLLATVAEVDVLVSWNFRHIVRLDKIRLFNPVNVESGYKPLTIYSPREVTTYEQHERNPGS